MGTAQNTTRDELLETDQEPEAEVTGVAPEDIVIKEDEKEDEAEDIVKIDEAAVEKIISEDAPLALNNSPYFHFSPSQLQAPSAVLEEPETKDYSSYGFQPTNLLPSFDVSGFDLFKSTNEYLEKQTDINGEIFNKPAETTTETFPFAGGEEKKETEAEGEEEEGNGMPVQFTIDALDLNMLLHVAAPPRTIPLTGAGPKLPTVGVALPQKIINNIASANLTSSVAELEASVGAMMNPSDLGTLRPARLQGVTLPTNSVLTPRTLSNPLLLGAGVHNFGGFMTLDEEAVVAGAESGVIADTAAGIKGEEEEE